MLARASLTASYGLTAGFEAMWVLYATSRYLLDPSSWGDTTA
jgi:hypothetical protein